MVLRPLIPRPRGARRALPTIRANVAIRSCPCRTRSPAAPDAAGQPCAVGRAGRRRTPVPARRQAPAHRAGRLAVAAAGAAGGRVRGHASRPARVVGRRRAGHGDLPTCSCAWTPPIRRCCWSRWPPASGRTSTVQGEAQFAADVQWLADNLRWDLEADLARLLGPLPARQLARLGAALAAGLRRRVSPAAGSGGADCAMSQLARLVFIAFTLLRFGVDDIALSGLRQRWVRALARIVDDRPPLRRAARRAPAPCAGAAGADLRQVRPGAVDAARPAAAGRGRRTGQAAGPRAAVSRRRSRWRWSSGPSGGASTRSSPVSTPSRWPAPRSRRCTSRRCTTAARWPSRCCARAC